MVAGLVTAPLIARSLGVEDRGHYAGLILASQFMAVAFSLGVPIACRSLLVQEIVGERQVKRAGIIVALIAAGFTLIASLFWRLGLGRDVETGLFWSATFFLACSCAAVLRAIEGSILVVRGDIRRLAAFVSIPAAVSFLGTCCLAAAEMLSLQNLLLVNAVGFLVQTFYTVRAIPQTSDSAMSTPRLIRQGLVRWPFTLIEAVTPRLDQFAVYAIGGPRLAGLYAIPALGVQVGLAVVTTFGFRLVAGVRENRIGLVLRRCIIIYSLLMGIAWSIAFIVAPTVVPLLFGEAFVDSLRLMPEAAIFTLCFGVSFLLLQATILLKSPRWLPWVWLLLLAGTFSAIYVTVSAVWAVIAVSIAGLILAVAGYGLVNWKHSH